MVVSRKEKKERTKSLENRNKRSKYKKKRWTKRSQTNIEWNIIQISLFQTTLTSLSGAFTIIFFHTLRLGHDTSLIKSTQIKDSLLSFKHFNLEKNFDLLTSLFYKRMMKKKTRLKMCVPKFVFKHWGDLFLVDMFSKLQN